MLRSDKLVSSILMAAAFVAAAAVAGCGSSSGGSPSSESSSSESPPRESPASGSASGKSESEFESEFSSVEVNRLGSFGQTEKEFQNAAIRNAVKHAQDHQVPGEAVERITIMGNEPVGSSLSQGTPEQANRPTSYRVWVKIQGCERDIMYTTSQVGRLISYTDDADCLAAARRGSAESPDGEREAPRGGQTF
ncbi:MAG: hypothetical protein QNJ30_23330 [Kiloniellales bacterium]|nr:hypothetical protein [Kiloniellales bacterium]